MANALYRTTQRYVSEGKQLGRFKPVTATNLRYQLTSFADIVGADLEVSRLRRRHIEKYLLSLTTQGPSTRRRKLSAVRNFCRWAVEHNLLAKDPTAGLTNPREPRAQPRSLTDDEVAKLLLAVDERGRLAVLLGVQEGLRASEITGLTTDRADLERRLLLVHGKGDVERWVPLSDQTADAIETYLAAHPAARGLPLLRSYRDEISSISTRHLSHQISNAMREAGIKHDRWDGKSFHATRHTCANDMLDNGADLRDVQEMLGHAHLSTTANIYAKRRAALHRLREAASGRNYGTPTDSHTPVQPPAFRCTPST